MKITGKLDTNKRYQVLKHGHPSLLPIIYSTCILRGLQMWIHTRGGSRISIRGFYLYKCKRKFKPRPFPCIFASSQSQLHVYNSYTNLWVSNLCQHGSKNLNAQFYCLVSLISQGKALLIKKNQCWSKPDNHRMLSLRHPGGFVWTPRTPTHTSLQSSKQCMNNNYYHDV